MGILFWRQAVDGFKELRTKVYLLNIVFLQLFNFPSESFSLIYYIIYHWLCWVFVAANDLSLGVVSRDYSLLRSSGFSLWRLLSLRHTGSVDVAFGFSCHGKYHLPRPGLEFMSSALTGGFLPPGPPGNPPVNHF